MHTSNDTISWIYTHIPFAALMASEEISQRPMLTRVLESLIVGVVAGAFAGYVSISAWQAVHSSQIEDLKASVAQEHADTMEQFRELNRRIDDLSAQQSQIWSSHH